MNKKFTSRYWVMAWWAAVISMVSLGLWATVVLHPSNSVPARVLYANPQKPIAYTKYKPIHFLFFNGNSSYGLIPANKKLNVHQFSISFWVKSDGANYSSFDHPVETLQWIKSPGGKFIPYGWAFDVGNQSKVGSNKIIFRVGNTRGNLFGVGPASVSQSSWTHIVGTFDGMTMKLYQNGILVEAGSFTGPYSYPVIPLPIRLAAGLLPGHYWTGDLSDIKVYGRALSQIEISSIFTGHNVVNGLIVHWPLNEGSGIIMHDLSGNNIKGVIHNGLWR